MPKWAYILALFAVTSCGGFRIFNEKALDQEREIASVAMERFIVEENLSFGPEIDQKLHALYSYYALAHRNLQHFDQSIPETELDELYQSPQYLGLLAIKTQVDELEEELIELSKVIGKQKSKIDSQRFFILKEKISKFSTKSKLRNLAMSNLANAMDIKIEKSFDLTEAEFNDELKELESFKDFRIFEKNVEHLAHLFETELKSTEKKFRPSETDKGNISGQEFPAKVWALTYNQGPHKSNSKKILNHLKEEGLKATFFQVTSKAIPLKNEVHELQAAGMEIASHSYSHKDLTKVGLLTLENEITDATQELNEKLKLNVKLFRLPYGAGIETPAIRQQIAKNKLIHVHWNVDSLDWHPQSAAKIARRTMMLMKKTKRDSGIILFHEQHDRSVEASRMIMKHVKLDGRRICTIGSIIDDMNKGRNKVCSTN